MLVVATSSQLLPAIRYLCLLLLGLDGRLCEQHGRQRTLLYYWPVVFGELTES